MRLAASVHIRAEALLHQGAGVVLSVVFCAQQHILCTCCLLCGQHALSRLYMQEQLHLLSVGSAAANIAPAG
jgi:hypothetical protein